MESLSLVIAMLLMVAHSYQVPMETLDDVLVYSVEAPTSFQKREISLSKNKQIDSSFDEFVEEKLLQHTQALEHLVKMVQNNEELTKILVENLTKMVDKPKLPEKVEVHRETRRSNNETPENVFAKISKNIPRYGTLIKDIILKELRNDPDPTTIVAQDSATTDLKFTSRRSFDGKPVVMPSLPTDNKISPWCPVAMLCRRTLNPICGYDDNFGYGKFDDVCHMLQVNCYWKYNFALVPSCKPTM